MRTIKDIATYDEVAREVGQMFDRVFGSRTQAARASTYAPSAVSNILAGHRRSWTGLKFLIRWFRQQHPGFGSWHRIGLLMVYSFPDELEWRQLLDSDVTVRTINA